MSLVFAELSNVGENTVAERLNVADSTISKWKAEQAELAVKIIAQCGLKIVPERVRCYEPKQMEAILALAKARLERIETTDQLIWEDPA